VNKLCVINKHAI